MILAWYRCKNCIKNAYFDFVHIFVVISHIVHGGRFPRDSWLTNQWSKKINLWVRIFLGKNTLRRACWKINHHSFHTINHWSESFLEKHFYKGKNNYFLHWNFYKKSCFVVFFHEWNEWKNLQFNFSSQNLISIERNFFKWDGKVTKILHLLFHRIWKNYFLVSPYILEMGQSM